MKVTAVLGVALFGATCVACGSSGGTGGAGGTGTTSTTQAATSSVTTATSSGSTTSSSVSGSSSSASSSNASSSASTTASSTTASSSDSSSSSSATASSSTGGSLLVPEVDCATAVIAKTIATNGTFMFVPDTATVNVGDVVQFIPTVDHTVLADDGSFFVGAGAVKCFMFATANSYPYKCTFHPFMVGTLTVQ